MTDDIKKIYKELGVNYRGTLIFGDTVRRPWSLQFDRDFLIERSININEFTVDIVKKYVQTRLFLLQHTNMFLLCIQMCSVDRTGIEKIGS